jgi:hypothetical protein
MVRMTNSISFKLFGLLLIASTLAITSAAQASEETPRRIQWESQSEAGLYMVTVRPEPDAIPIGDMHRWTIEILTRDGEPVYPAQISIGGGMQSHGHGLPTQPSAVAYGGDGIYLIDGVRFTMEGQWRLSFVIASDHGRDRVDFDIVVEF